MISASSANEAAKFYTHHWTITLPSYPSLKYIHTTIPHLESWLALISDPSLFPYDAGQAAKVWDASAKSEFLESSREKYTEAYTKFNELKMMIEVGGEVIGGADYFLLPTGAVNLGLMLSEKARGKGLGKLTMQVLIQLGRAMGIRKMGAGTMKANKPMQGLMKSMGIQGRDETKEVTGRGVVAEILYEIPQEVGWEDLDLKLEFGDPVFGSGLG